MLRDPETTTDRLLGGRVTLRQPRDGLRAAIDPVLLAAGIPALAGQHVLEAGCGTGAAFLCLAARIPGLHIVAMERDPALAALARHNAAANGAAAGVEVVCGDVADGAPATQRGRFAHGFANPPWWPDGTPPPGARRAAATHAAATSLADWAAYLAAAVAPGGSVSLLLPAARLDAGLAALAAAGCGGPIVVPCWPRAGQPATRVLLRARRDRAGPLVLAAGLVLHPTGSGYTAAAEAVLRHAAPLSG